MEGRTDWSEIPEKQLSTISRASLISLMNLTITLVYLTECKYIFQLLSWLKRKDNWVMFHHFIWLLRFVFSSFWKSFLLSLGVNGKVLWVCLQTRFQVFSKNCWSNTEAARTVWPCLSRGSSPGVSHNLCHSMILRILLKLSFTKISQPEPAKVQLLSGSVCSTAKPWASHPSNASLQRGRWTWQMTCLDVGT